MHPNVFRSFSLFSAPSLLRLFTLPAGQSSIPEQSTNATHRSRFTLHFEPIQKRKRATEQVSYKWQEVNS